VVWDVVLVDDDGVELVEVEELLCLVVDGVTELED
jgi:hypothetical protein